MKIIDEQTVGGKLLTALSGSQIYSSFTNNSN